MPPLFLGGEDDWLDGVEDAFRHKAGKKPVENRAKTLRPEEGNGTVTEIFPNQSAARLDGRSNPSLCRYRMSTLAFGAAKRERSPVCVGDRVRVEAGVIVGRCDRRNRIIRPAPNARDPLLHVLAANLDCLVIVAAAREPEFSSGIVDRFLVAASAQKIRQILCINKADLMEPHDPRPWAHYPAAGVTVVETSVRDGRGTDRLSALLAGKVCAFCGHSGVGKTSLLRRLLGDENYGRVGALSQSGDKGRHTTSGAVLRSGPGGSSLIDTPGVMNFGLIDVSRGDLLSHFPELSEASARCGRDCRHDAEEACVLRSLPRHASYRHILSSL
ncbi:MAG: ribosome small subunit-dependent GTPase A [Elusimicrobiota bacterium]